MDNAVQALIGIHRPTDAADLEASKRRMAFEELLLLQLKLLLRREIERTPRSDADVEGTRISQLSMMQAGRQALRFTLTDAQDRVLTEVCASPLLGTDYCPWLSGCPCDASILSKTNPINSRSASILLVGVVLNKHAEQARIAFKLYLSQ